MDDILTSLRIKKLDNNFESEDQENMFYELNISRINKYNILKSQISELKKKNFNAETVYKLNEELTEFSD